MDELFARASSPGRYIPGKPKKRFRTNAVVIMTTFKTLVAERLTQSIKTGAAVAATCLAASLTLGANGAQAAGYAGTQFEIEMVVFSRTQGMNASRETWPTNPTLSYDSKWVDFNTPSSADPMVPALQPAANQLNNKAAALRRDPAYQVLFHKTWRQVLQTERNAPSVLIDGGEVNGDHHQLAGSVKLSVSRYLHLSTDLWLSEWADQSENSGQWSPAAQRSFPSGDESAPAGIAVPTRPRAPVARQVHMPGDEPMGLTSAAGQGTVANSNSRTDSGGFSTSADRAVFHGEDGEIDAMSATTRSLEKIAKRVAVLQEERRLRSGELHYIDHPKLGVLIEVRTVTPSAEDDIEPAGLTD